MQHHGVLEVQARTGNTALWTHYYPNGILAVLASLAPSEKSLLLVLAKRLSEKQKIDIISMGQ